MCSMNCGRCSKSQLKNKFSPRTILKMSGIKLLPSQKLTYRKQKGKFFVAPHKEIGKCGILQKYSHFVPYFCGEAGIEAGCKQVLIMPLRGVFNFNSLGSEDSAIIL